MKLTSRNHTQMEILFGKILDVHKDGTVSRNSAIGVLAQIMTALADNNTDEVSSWLTKPDTFENWCRTASDQK